MQANRLNTSRSFAKLACALLFSYACCAFLYVEAYGDEAGETSAVSESSTEAPSGNNESILGYSDESMWGDAASKAYLLENSWRFNQGHLIESEDSNPYAIAQYSSESPVRGIDVSEHQGNIDWDKVKQSGVKFAIIRIGFAGYDFGGRADYYWQRNVSECERLNIPYGVYLYSYADSVWKASSEAGMVVDLLRGHHPSLPVYYDLEDDSIDKSNIAAVASTFCNRIQSSGYSVGVYANLYWWNSFLTDSCFDKWDKWVAQYNYQCDYDGQYSVWQHTSKAYIDGINGYVDENYWNGIFPYGWIEKDGKRYYFNSDGAMAHGEALVGGSWYHFDEVTGEMTVGFADVPDGSGSTKLLK